jgi:Cu(I)/Ag(I) efflux system periplasmic protein CusF
MNTPRTFFLLVAAALSLPMSVWAQSAGYDLDAVVPASKEAPKESPKQAPKQVQANPWSQAEVRRIDLSARKITLKHGPIAVLGMDPMTMVFQLRDEAAFKAAQSLKPGDKIEFVAAYDKGAYLVQQIRPAQPTAGAQNPR